MVSTSLAIKSRGRQDEVHPHVPLGDTIASPDDAEFDGHAASLRDAPFDRFGQAPQMIVPGTQFRKGIGDAETGLAIVSSSKPMDLNRFD
jgi:hypothetical protein